MSPWQNPGKRIEYVTSSAISLYEDQFFPYCAFGCDMRIPFPGTLFRFPLRNADQASNSKLSKQVYLEEDISSMFVQLYEEGVFTLLFLKSVLSIEMYIWDVGVPMPRKVYSCSINSANDDTVWHRQTLLRLSKSIDFSDPLMDAFSLDFLSEAVMESHSQKRLDTFYMVQTMASTSSRIGSFAAAASKNYDIHLLPWASVAACVSDDLSNDNILKLGRAFCFLPLPVRTGMTVQVNGYFEVSSNRRGIWYGADMDRSGKIRSLWNRLLLEDVVAPTFTQLLLGVQRLLGPTESYYSLWPSGSFEEPWNILVEHIYQNIGDAPVLYSDSEGGKWVSPLEAFLHDEEFSGSKDLGEALVQLGMPVVHLPKDLFDMLLKCGRIIQQKVVTPDSVRHYIRECRSVITLSRSHKLVLLEYCLEDLLDAAVSRHAYNLPLLPLASGDFGGLSEASKGISYFVCNELEYKLVQQISDRIIDHDIPPALFGRLSSIAKSSKTNLCVFNVNYFLQFFSKFVPADWKYNSKVFWDPKSNLNHPTSSWFALFWDYLRAWCEKLSLFDDWPILPSLSGHLHRPSLQSKLLNVEKLSEKMRDILVKIGCKILSNSFDVDHPELSYYVNDADAAGILESIFDVPSSDNSAMHTFQHVKAEERDELRRFLLDPKWYIGSHMANSDLWKCKRLPIYRVYGEESSQTLQYSDLENPHKSLPPIDVPESFLGAEFICSSSSTEEEVLNRYYGIEQMRKASFYKQHVLHRVKDLQPDVRDNIMLSLLQELPQLCVEDASFKEYLRNLEFIPTSNGSLKSPSALYDPRNEELYDLLEDSDSFPCGVFQESGILDMLQGLGLGMTVSPETVIQSARQVEWLMHEDQQRAYMKGKVLLSFLEVNALKWLPNPLNDDRGTLNRMVSRAATGFRPRNLKSDLEKFWSDLRMICWCPVLVSCPYQALPWPAVSSMVAPPKLVRLYRDLWLVSASMRILDGECSSTALSRQLGWSSPPGGSVIAGQLLELGKNNEIVNDQVLRQELALEMPRIYTILMGMIGSDEMDVVKAVLEGCRWIWVGDGFAISDEVVLNGPLHLAPYIRVIPVDLAAFRDLFLELGIREFLKPSDYASILCRMAKRKGSTPLVAQEIRAAILIAQHLAEVQSHEQQIKIYLPDLSGRLIIATDLAYNDAPWLLGAEEPSNSFGNASTLALTAKRTVQKFVHGNISNDVAEKLGVRSLRRMLLAESADSMNLSLSGAAEAFGQHEALTTRLKHILEMYADGPGILFELVQNAEDARASEVIFLLDKTQYGTSSVLSPEMADWQGPALHTHICFWENIVMFDPHACNLPGISPSHPGLRIKFVGRKILEQFPDQFSPFLHFGCDLLHPFPGTLFRFPLRSESIASRSQIKKEGYAPEDVISLFSSFSEVVSETLLFLRNVKTISIFVKEGASNEMQLLHHVHKQCVSDPEAEASKFHNLFSFMHGNQQDGVDKDQFLNKLSKSADMVLPWKCQKIVSVKVDTEFSDIPNTEEPFIVSPDIIQVPNTSIQDRKNFEGRAFCFLPLPINTGLFQFMLIHILNCHQTGGIFWFGNDMAGGGKKRSDWNVYLLEHVLAPAYGHLLEKVASEIDAGLPVVTVPKPLVEKFMEFCPLLHFLSPQLLRSLLIRRKREFKDRNSMILTLEYCLLDLRVPVQCDTLYGLPLVPLSNGLFTTFERQGVGERIYVARGDEYGLLKDVAPHKLVDSEISGYSSREVRLFPPEWQHAKQVAWVPGLEGQPSLEWMGLLWGYLKSSCDDLSVFSKWPILPVGNHYLLQLVKNSNVIEDDGWSENMSSLLTRVGCLILRSDLVIEHAQLKIYVQPPTATGLLNALLAVAGNSENIEGLFRDAAEGEMHELRSFILQSKWFSEDSMDVMHFDIIKQLPIFESFRSRKLVCLSKPIKWLKPNGVRDDLIDDTFIRTESEKEKVILRNYLEIRELSRAEFYKDYVLNRMPEFMWNQEALLAILQDVKLLIAEDNSIRTTLSSTAFVLACNGSWNEPSRSVSMLHVLKDSETVNYGRRLLFCLDAIAVKLTQEDQRDYNELKSAIECQNNCVADGETEYFPERSENCFEDGLNIDSIIGNLIGNEPGEEFWSELKAITWCPVFADPPLQGLPWLESMYLQRKLGWMGLPSMDVLSTQLIGLSKSYARLKLHSTVEPDFDTVLQKELPLLYSKLQEYVGTDDFMVLKSSLDGVDWVWIGDDFVLDSVFDVLDYFHVLQRLQMDVKGSTLSSDQLSFVNCVLEAVADCYSDKPFEASNTPLLIPDSSGILTCAADLVYNDSLWMENTLVGKHFVHPSISNDLANRLGVQSLHCLSLVSEELTKDLPCMDYARICDLLGLYGNGELLLFDLLELADCCKAKKFHLIFDKREHPRQSLLQHNLGEFQGPALLAILEGVSLSMEELSNLQFLPPWRLRGDTLNYGLGLLSCFHICDLPSIVSGGCLYMFDPRGLAFAVPSSSASTAKMFSLIVMTLKLMVYTLNWWGQFGSSCCKPLCYFPTPQMQTQTQPMLQIYMELRRNRLKGYRSSPRNAIPRFSLGNTTEMRSQRGRIALLRKMGAYRNKLDTNRTHPSQIELNRASLVSNREPIRALEGCRSQAKSIGEYVDESEEE
ncbi:zinc finger, C3HC4 type (RING finger) family protein [Actinidia rufa]|uniref:Zinc finger, C3HC4 type (RING finger) family protein n=1 Tax=Actinidia rufa TaxID=165716 RepID=A0A7J0GYB1_9ERIC|nr:zinc finger, C3HC4 type (RING finger) family protein [Actinidia rufa]